MIIFIQFYGGFAENYLPFLINIKKKKQLANIFSVLIFGFAIFTLSSFGGTIALGGLISVTLTFAMFANLVVLPALVLTTEKWSGKKEILEESSINIYRDNNEEIEEEQKEE